MTYAPSTRAFYDADSHIMELPDFLKKYADPGLRDDIPEVSYSASLVTDQEVAEIMARGGRHSAEHVAELVAMGDRLIETSKEIQALGAFDAAERSRAVDMLGFKRQLVFATHSVAMPFNPTSKLDPKLRYGAVGVNLWPAFAFALGTTPWGAYPGSTLTDIRSGRGFVHNTLMIEDVEKCVLRYPATAFPKPPYFPTHKTAHVLGRRVTFFEEAPSLLRLPSVVAAALGG